MGLIHVWRELTGFGLTRKVGEMLTVLKVFVRKSANVLRVTVFLSFIFRYRSLNIFSQEIAYTILSTANSFAVFLPFFNG